VEISKVDIDVDRHIDTDRGRPISGDGIPALSSGPAAVYVGATSVIGVRAFGSHNQGSVARQTLSADV
jgi:hypothetical protein